MLNGASARREEPAGGTWAALRGRRTAVDAQSVARGYCRRGNGWAARPSIRSVQVASRDPALEPRLAFGLSVFVGAPVVCGERVRKHFCPNVSKDLSHLFRA